MLVRSPSSIAGTRGEPPSSFLWDYNPATDTEVYDTDDTFSVVTTIAELTDLRDDFLAGPAPYYIYAPPINPADMEATASFIAGFGGRPRALRFTLPGGTGEQKIKYEVFRDSGLAYDFNPAGTYLIVQATLRFDLPLANSLWGKGLELRNAVDRVQYGWYHTSDSLYWGNVNHDSNLKQIYFGQPDLTGNSGQYYTWAEIDGEGWLTHTCVYLQNTTTGSTTTGKSLWYVNQNPVVLASSEGLAAGWMDSRRYQIDASDTDPYPGNVAEKNGTYGGSPAVGDVTVTGTNALQNLSARLTTGIGFPDIVNATSAGTGTIDVGRILVYYRSA